MDKERGVLGKQENVSAHGAGLQWAPKKDKLSEFWLEETFLSMLHEEDLS